MEDCVCCCKMIITRSLYIGVGSDLLIMETFEDSQPLAFHIYIITQLFMFFNKSRLIHILKSLQSH